MCQMCVARDNAQSALDSESPAAFKAALAKLNGVKAAYLSNDIVAACGASRGPIVSTLGVAHALGILAAVAKIDIEKVIEVARSANTEAVAYVAKDMAELEASMPPFLVEVMKSKALSADERNEQFTAANEQMVAAFKEAEAQAEQPETAEEAPVEEAPAHVASQDDREGVTVTPA